MQQVEVQMWPVDRLVPYIRNPRKNDAAVDRMAASIREFGFKISVLARSNDEVVDGHLRLKAAKKLGITEVPVTVCDEWTPIIWDKGRTVFKRTHYWFQHEPCWYVRKKNAPWFGKAGENLTIWSSPSPKFIMGGSDEEKFDHPTQKPVELMRRPILNHTRRGDLVYEPFLGSGTTLAATGLTQRVCYGLELDPKYVDVVIGRWQTLSGKKAALDDDGRTFDELAAERRRSEQPSTLEINSGIPRSYT